MVSIESFPVFVTRDFVVDVATLVVAVLEESTDLAEIEDKIDSLELDDCSTVLLSVNVVDDGEGFVAALLYNFLLSRADDIFVAQGSNREFVKLPLCKERIKYDDVLLENDKPFLSIFE